MDLMKHNYYRKLKKLYEQGKLPKGSWTNVEVYHDDWCGVNKGGYCNCDPEFELLSQSTDHGESNPYLEEGVASVQSFLNEDTQPLQIPNTPCPHCGSREFILWSLPPNAQKRAISCNGCGAVVSSTHPLDPDDRPMRRP